MRTSVWPLALGSLLVAAALGRALGADPQAAAPTDRPKSSALPETPTSLRFPETALRPEMIRIEPGEFQMGSPPLEEGYSEEERQHTVRITQPFLIGRTEVTQGQYEAMTGNNPSEHKISKNHPAEYVTWFVAVQYCNLLSTKEGLPACYKIEGTRVSWPEQLKCRGYRLPTEAEWEYAARAGQATIYAGAKNLDEVSWLDQKPHEVATKRPNQWGLYDMTGNLWEWVWDWYDQNYYKTSPQKNPLGPLKAGTRETVTQGPRFPGEDDLRGTVRKHEPWRSRRGGSWINNEHVSHGRVASRDGVPPDLRVFDQGFRLARSLP